jgi:hypothetical protein
VSRIAVFTINFALVACGSSTPPTPPPPADAGALRFNEIVSDNEGVFVDEQGETDDYLEIYNSGTQPENLREYSLRAGKHAYPLPAQVVAPGDVALLWADGTPEQGARHLPFKISAGGERLQLSKGDNVVDSVTVPALAPHHAYSRVPDGAAFVDCEWATPQRLNGASCGPPKAPKPEPGETFPPFAWPEPWPRPPASLVITKLLLHPARAVEVLNRSSASVDLTASTLSLAPLLPGVSLPAVDGGARLEWPQPSLGAGERVLVPVTEADVGDLAHADNFAGVASLFSGTEASDRVEFSGWPEGASLERSLSGSGTRFCREAESDESDPSCEPLPAREIHDHERGLFTPGDFHALAAARAELGAESVEFIVDLQAGGTVTFLNSANWDLHYTFIRENIRREPHLDRCDPAQRTEYELGWYAFSQQEYFQVEGRRYLLGTLVRHAGTALSTLEFSPGDVISAAQMQLAFFTVMRHVPDPTAWAIRPQTPDQLMRIREIEGQVPIVSADAPFIGVTFQALSPGVAYGTLRHADANDLGAVGPRDIVVTEQVPNDIPLIAGLITESFQTPLAHVNVLSRGRGTPNMALQNALADARLEPLFDTLVRLEVTGNDFSVRPAAPDEALAFWDSRRPNGSTLTPRLDASVRGPVPLEGRSLVDLPAIGGKAAQLAMLMSVPLCPGPVSVPERPFAIPVVHSVEHLRASGAADILTSLRADPAFLADPSLRAQGLARVKQAILSYPVEPELHAQVMAAIAERWPERPLRFRSSSNVEDLAGFNGAGLYDSIGVEPEEEPAGVDDAIREVWASLWNDRAFAERDYYNVDQTQVAMAVLVHPGFHSERANGVAISRDVLEPLHSDRYYINAQVGEALVTNPAPGIRSDAFTYQAGGWQEFVFQEHSSFNAGVPVLSEAETKFLACNLAAIHRAFRPLLDPDEKNPWFAVDIEFKLMGPERSLLIKQARSYSFGASSPTAWCDL